VAVPFLSFESAHSRVRREVLAEFERFFDSRRYILGSSVEAFEEAYARFSTTRFCVGVGNGLDALILALGSLGVGPGDEVVVPSNTYVATWLAVSRVGATIRPVEPDPETFNIDPERIEEVICERTKAILPVHLYGQACDMVAVRAVADRHHLWVVEDNAQAHGAHNHGRRTGSIGHVNATSFYPTKNLGALGDAGAVTTDDEVLAEYVRMARNYGSIEKNINRMVGVNTRLDELQAGILLVKLRHLGDWNEERRRIAEWYRAELADLDELQLPGTSADCEHVYHLYVVRTPRRDGLRGFLAERGIGTLIHYPQPPHLQPAYRHVGFEPGSFPIAEELARTSLSLPFFVGMTPAQIREVGKGIRDFFVESGGEP